MPRKVMNGRVVSDKMEKTVVVKVMRASRHPLYRKVVRRSKNYMAHDEDGMCAVGDMVSIEESRPISRHKRWRVIEVTRRARS